MTFGMVFLTALMAVIVWWLLRQTVNVRPWEAGLISRRRPAS